MDEDSLELADSTLKSVDQTGVRIRFRGMG